MDNCYADDLVLDLIESVTLDVLARLGNDRGRTQDDRAGDRCAAVYI